MKEYIASNGNRLTIHDDGMIEVSPETPLNGVASIVFRPRADDYSEIAQQLEKHGKFAESLY